MVFKITLEVNLDQFINTILNSIYWMCKLKCKGDEYIFILSNFCFNDANRIGYLNTVLLFNNLKLIIKKLVK